jgi:hypothetical protein
MIMMRKVFLVIGGLALAGIAFGQGPTVRGDFDFPAGITYDLVGMKVHKSTASATFNSDVAFLTTFNVVDYNLGGGSLLNSNSRYTPAVAGVYRTSVITWWSCSRAITNADNIQTFFLKNGTAFTRQESKIDRQATRFTTESTATISMNGSTDYIEVQLLAANGGAAFTCDDFSDGGQPFSQWSVEYIGRN